MSKLTEKQIAKAKNLLKQYPSEKQVFVKVENGHMYFKKEAALISVGADENKLEVVTGRDEQVTDNKAAQEKAAADKAAKDKAAQEKAAAKADKK